VSRLRQAIAGSIESAAAANQPSLLPQIKYARPTRVSRLVRGPWRAARPMRRPYTYCGHTFQVRFGPTAVFGTSLISRADSRRHSQPPITLLRRNSSAQLGVALTRADRRRCQVCGGLLSSRDALSFVWLPHWLAPWGALLLKLGFELS